MIQRATVLSSLLCLVLAPARLHARKVAIIVDTSGSMGNNDRPRYTVLASQIIGDLLATSDQLTVIRLPSSQRSCADGADMSLAIRLKPGDRAGFKRQVDSRLTYSGDNAFAAPVRTAISVLGNSGRRLLLFIADADGFGNCKAELVADLAALARGGATVAAINLRRDNGGEFKGFPPFGYSRYARSSKDVLFRLAEVYQRFLGAKHVQTGGVSGRVKIKIDPYVRQAFLVVATTGTITGLTSSGGNPTARSLDLNYRAGGQVRGLDGSPRTYRIVRLDRPGVGAWSFSATGIGSDAGYMLIQEYAVRARMISPGQQTAHKGTLVEVEIVDDNTGKRVDPAGLPELEVSSDGPDRLTFRDDGKDGDRVAGDGVFTARKTFSTPGKTSIPVRVRSRYTDQRTSFEVTVIKQDYELVASVPPTTTVERPTLITARAAAVGGGAVTWPRTVVVSGGASLVLRDDGKAPDARAGDQLYSGTWKPGSVGKVQLTFRAQGGGKTHAVSAHSEVLGVLDLGLAVPIKLGRVVSNDQGAGTLDLSGSKVRGSYKVSVSTAFDPRGSVLELNDGKAWVPLADAPATLTLTGPGARQWPVRVRVGRCPRGFQGGDAALVITAAGPGGAARKLTIPVTVVVVPDAWLTCYWWVLAAVATGLLLAFAVYGYIWPFAFNRHVGVVISPEPDILEGFFHPIRKVKGTRKKFYKHATAYVCADYRISGKPANAVVKLRAKDKRVTVEAMPGFTIERQNAEEEWEELPEREVFARFGVLFRYGQGDLYFEIRNKPIIS